MLIEHEGPVELSWPLVGRAAELERVDTILLGNRGAIVLAGPAGVGKTRLATECLGLAAARGFVPLRVAATQGAAGLPFGAFASLVPDLAPSTDLLEVLRQIVREVAQRGEGRPVAVFVDDAHLLDEASAALTHLLATTPETFVLATLRSGEPAPEPIVALWKDGWPSASSCISQCRLPAERPHQPDRRQPEDLLLAAGRLRPRWQEVGLHWPE
jgi:hypothetical protein